VDKRFGELCCFQFQVRPCRWEMLCLKYYPPIRPQGVITQKTVISGKFFLRIVHSNGWSNNDCNEGESDSPFLHSVSHFTFILLQKHIRGCAVSSLLHFHRLFVAKRQRLYETMAVCPSSE
jgi:hypothetical protein